MYKSINIFFAFFSCFIFSETSAQDSTRFVSAYQQADSVTKKKIYQLDSVKNAADNGLQQIKTEYDSIQSVANNFQLKLQSSIDSLTHLNLPITKPTSKLDSMRRSSEAKLKALKTKWDGVKTSATEKVNSLNLPPPWNEGQSKLTTAVQNADLQLPASKLKLPEMEWNKSLSLHVPGFKNPVGNLSLDQPITLFDKGPLNQVNQYKEQAEQLAKGNPDKLIDKEVVKIAEVKTLQEQTGLMNDELALLQAKDAQAAKQQYLTMARKAAMEHFDGKFDHIDAAMDKMKGLKKKYPNVESIKELQEKIPNEMQGKPFAHRIVVALGLQLQRQNDWMLDLSPSLGYRFSGRITGGGAWNQRAAYNFKNDRWVRDAFIHGPRIFGEYYVNKGGMALRLESDYMLTKVPYYNKFYTTETQQREWIWGIMIGIRKTYKLSKKIEGNLQALYNVYDPDSKSPHERFNLRIGFEWKKK